MSQKKKARMKGDGLKGRGWDFAVDVADGRDWFVHRLDVNGELPGKGAYITFEPGTFAGKEKAINVEVVS